MKYKYKSYFLRDVPEEDHKKAKAAARGRKMPLRLWLIEAIKEKLEREAD